MAKESLAFYLRFFEGKKLPLLLSSLLLVVQPVALMALLHLIRHQLDITVNQGQWLPLLLVSAGLVLLYLISGGVALYIRHRMLQLTYEVTHELRHQLISRLYAYSRMVYAHFDRKQLQTVLVQDIIRIDIMANTIAGLLIPGMVIVLTMTVFLVATNFTMFAILACLFPVLMTVEKTVRPRLQRLIKGHHRSLEDLQKKTLFGLEALDLTHAHDSSQMEIDQQIDAGKQFRTVSSQLTILREAIAFTQDLLTLIISIVCLLSGAWFVREHVMSLGELLAFYMALLVIRPHLRASWNTLPHIVEGIESLKTIRQWMNLPDRPLRFGTRHIHFTGDVRFRAVNFSYSTRLLLRNINLRIHPGETVIISGPNGTGKSTIAYLLLGFYQPISGTIEMDGQSMRDIDITSLRRQCGVVLQHPLIFQGSIRDNISYGAPDAKEAEILRASRLARVDEFVQSLDDGYQSIVGDNGMLLSGGQRQRIALARALLRLPPLLVLDEPSTYLDTQTVEAVMRGLRSNDYRPAILLITHDRKLMEFGDCVFHLEHGSLHCIDQIPDEAAITT